MKARKFYVEEVLRTGRSTYRKVYVQEVLRRGKTDAFKFATNSIGNLTHVTLGHRRRQGSVVKGTGKETS